MRFLTGYYWQEQERNRTSLTLQQIRMKKNEDSILLACVCESRDFCAWLTDWLHEDILAVYKRKNCVDWDKVSEDLQRMKAGFSCAGILCMGEEFLLFGQGKQRIYLLNRGFQKAHIRKLTGTGAFTNQKQMPKMHRGMMEPGVSLLLATEPFYTALTEQMLGDCLGGDIREERQGAACLRELGQYGEERGGRNLGAIWVHSYENTNHADSRRKKP
ncbi:MAG: hypothetical protein NC094_06085 [Bacteroidales bacterium]|nr:hypothetical protein [Lachnoclostridium sp.]MCM1383308.1 hypothetical protein [Lachnoclostridium sp.]MCM1464972.1 hypothetical protein [Bacteroidales bacterium]